MIPVVEIIRLEENEEHGTFGVMKINKEVFCVTLELADRENQTSRSSIPAQQYLCKRYISPKFGETFIVDNVPGRSFILIHPGNKDEDTEGCILIGQYWEKHRIWNSRITFNRFMEAMKGHDVFHLTVKEEF